ncbi:hypothetical protein LCGC14_1367300 [marine sediment metagenome]|uniref:GTP cyclohydrolase I n=1 Tax=marine sediment metagenome TaxID=412755 RepID=A0A0F9N8D1_9ZZZZ
MNKVEKSIAFLISSFGEDPGRSGLRETPKRMAETWKFLFSGYGKKPDSVITSFDAENYDQLILLKDIEFYSMCEHHLIPFFGKAHIAYIPDPKGAIVGVSKLARILDIYSRRMQIQERIGDQVTSAIMSTIQPRGAACILEATHLCMRMRGVEKQNSIMVTSSLKGIFLREKGIKEEFLALIRHGKDL